MSFNIIITTANQHKAQFYTQIVPLHKVWLNNQKITTVINENVHDVSYTLALIMLMLITMMSILLLPVIINAILRQMKKAHERQNYTHIIIIPHAEREGQADCTVVSNRWLED